MARNSPLCADVPLRNYSLTHTVVSVRPSVCLSHWCIMSKQRSSASTN